MRFTYVKDDKLVGIDGDFLEIDNSNFDQEVHAIQWYDTYGEIEFTNYQERNNEIFEDISYIQPLIDLWTEKKEQQGSVPLPRGQNAISDTQTLTNFLNS
jgi:hypothetical protein